MDADLAAMAEARRPSVIDEKNVFSTTRPDSSIVEEEEDDGVHGVEPTAEELAQVDLPAALALTAALSAPRAFDRHHGNIAQKLAGHDPAEAERVRAEAVLASIGDAFYLLDRDWRFTHVNDAAEPLLETTREQLLGRTGVDGTGRPLQTGLPGRNPLSVAG